MFSTGFTSLMSYFFFLYWSLSLSLCMVFGSVSSNTDEVLSINPSGNILSFKTLTSIIRTGLPILAELIDLVNSVIIFLSQMILLRWLTFILGSQTVILTVLLFWISFFQMLVFVQQLLPLLWEILIMFLSRFYWLSIKFTKGCSISLHSLWLFSCWLGWSSWSFERCSMGGYLWTWCFCCC